MQNLRDPATPWISAVGMRRALGSDAVLLGVDQGGHTAYLTTDNTCVENTTTAFLTDGVLPPGPRLCPAGYSGAVARDRQAYQPRQRT